MEVCNIVNGQQAYRRLTDQQTADMIRYTAVKPEERFRKIQEIVSLFKNFFVFSIQKLLLAYNIASLEK